MKLVGLFHCNQGNQAYLLWVGDPLTCPEARLQMLSRWRCVMAAVENTSGQGAGAAVPDEIKGWNGGAFLLTWIWAIAHNVWIGLLALIPILTFIMAIVLLVKGSEWAWQNRRFESVEQFWRVQTIWAYWGLGVMVAALLTAIVPSLLRMAR